MRRILKIFLLLASFALLSFRAHSNDPLVLAFVTYNDHGNNLYIDNIFAGKRVQQDITVTGILNIPSDTVFTPSSSAFWISPEIVTANLGSIAIASQIQFIVNIPQLSYSDTSAFFQYGAGEVRIIEFDSVQITPGSIINISAFTNHQDTIPHNNSFEQSTVFLTGAPRIVMIQEFLSATSAGAMQQTISLNNFIHSNFDSIAAIKIHRGVPPPVRDSMFIANIEQSDSLRDYYGTNSVPTAIADGIRIIQLPYSLDSNLIKPYNERRAYGSPLSVTVTDTHLGDSIRADININVLYNLPSGNYRLKLNAIERMKTYFPKPSGWYDSVFYDVFRKAIPGINGIPIPNTTGNYNFQITYSRNAQWVDSLVYSTVYIQNEGTKEILNSAKGRNYKDRPLQNVNIPNTNTRDISDPEENITSGESIQNLRNNNLIDFGYAELFEAGFLPSGFSLSNPDGSFTFTKFAGANGIQFSGSSSVRMPFYDYSGSGQRDTLFTRVLTGLQYNDSIKFDYAYAPYSTQYSDSLKVLLSTDGGATFPVTVFNKGGSSLATTGSMSISFVPSSGSQWRSFAFSLNGIVGIEENNIAPSSFYLAQNYPNPFNPVTNISFSIPSSGLTILKVYDISGREVKTIFNEFLQAGSYKEILSMEGLSSGIYFYKLTTRKYSSVKKMVLLK